MLLFPAVHLLRVNPLSERQTTLEFTRLGEGSPSLHTPLGTIYETAQICSPNREMHVTTEIHLRTVLLLMALAIPFHARKMHFTQTGAGNRPRRQCREMLMNGPNGRQTTSGSSRLVSVMLLQSQLLPIIH